MGWRDIKFAILRMQKICILFIILSLSLMLLLYKMYWDQSSHKKNREDEKRSPSRTILLWHRPFGASFSLDGNICLDLFNVPGCKVVDERSYFSSADVVVFHNRELINGQEKLPLHLPHPQGQSWAWLTMESPPHNGNLKPFANIFNMTITYRRDSDVYAPYGELHPRKDEGQPVEGVPPNKTFFACWVVSNFQNYHKRNQVYNELKKFIPIEVYGQWVGQPLSNENLIPTLQHCRFYLAFENSQYKDYITEKLWHNAYKSGAIPVVFGASLDDYKAVAPPHSFIHVDEFATVKDLSEYLMQVAKDDKRYKEYFAWKQKWEVKRMTDWRSTLCKICTVLDSLPAHRVYSDLEAWDKAVST
ncbi:alpha-(1,3)-fucosyltransferase 7 [Nelusetta ayraudi]|uniref:alpha-(1,3)-fucosyltransferase 7 n=1 Tax=Nelusetta ayraudi TaxID=303726 RepID=UPI003F6F8FF1